MSASQSEIVELSFTEPVTVAAQVRHLLPTIEHYRSQGHSLRKIYGALLDSEHLSSCKWRTFETIYYRIREAESADSAGDGV